MAFHSGSSIRSTVPPPSVWARASRWKCQPATTRERNPSSRSSVLVKTSIVPPSSGVSSQRRTPWASPEVSSSRGGTYAVMVACMVNRSPSGVGLSQVRSNRPPRRGSISTSPTTAGRARLGQRGPDLVHGVGKMALEADHGTVLAVGHRAVGRAVIPHAMCASALSRRWSSSRARRSPHTLRKGANHASISESGPGWISYQRCWACWRTLTQSGLPQDAADAGSSRVGSVRGALPARRPAGGAPEEV